MRRRSVAVGVKWTSGDSEMIVGRVIPPVGTSTRMFVAAGRDLPMPKTVGDFNGATTLNAAKAFIERAFGIGDLGDEPDLGVASRGRATVRLVTPYLFVTKEVIYSELVLLHGLERPAKLATSSEAMPYFLRVIDEASAMDERRLRQLQRALEKEEVLERSRAASDSALKQRAVSLLAEAHRIGISPPPSDQTSEANLLAQLRAVTETQLEAKTYPAEGELGALHTRRQEILAELGAARRQSQATRTAIREATGFEGAVTRQREKLMLAEHLHLEDVAAVCPLCEAPSERGRETVKALQSTLLKVSGESAAVERVKPRLIEHDRALDETIARLNAELRRVDDQIQTWLRQSEETRRLTDLAQARAHLLGRISFFLEMSVDQPRQPSRDLSVLRSEIAELEARVNFREATDGFGGPKQRFLNSPPKPSRRCRPWRRASAPNSIPPPHANPRLPLSKRKAVSSYECRTWVRTRITSRFMSRCLLRCNTISKR